MTQNAGTVVRWATAIAIVVMGSASAAPAAVIYVNIDPDRILTGETFIFDVDNDGTKDLLFDQQTNCVGNCQTIASVSALSGAILMSSPTDVTPLPAGTIIGPGGLTYGPGGLLATDFFSGNPPVTTNEEGLWDNGLLAFVGFNFVNASGTHYGWARVKVDETSNVITVFDAAYEDVAGTAIQASVPEPGLSALLLAGAAAMAVRRFRRA
jgi:hypothetical protein